MVRLENTPGWCVSTNFYGLDGHGSLRFLSGMNGAVTDTYAYSGYGIPLASSGSTANNYLYTGQQFDPDFGLYYLCARFLNKNTGRFWTMDRFGGARYAPMSLHKYLYADDDPFNRLDPTGEMTLVGQIGWLALGSVLERRRTGPRCFNMNFEKAESGRALIHSTMAFSNNLTTKSTVLALGMRFESDCQ